MMNKLVFYFFNFFSQGPLRSRAAKAIGFIDMMIDYSSANAPLQKELTAGNISLKIVPSCNAPFPISLHK